MADRVHKQRPRGENLPGIDREVPLPTSDSAPQASRDILEDTDKTLGSIDDVLAQNDSVMSPISQLADGESAGDANSPVDPFFEESLGLSSSSSNAPKSPSPGFKPTLGKPSSSSDDKDDKKSASKQSSSSASSEARKLSDILDQDNQDFLNSIKEKQAKADGQKVNRFNLGGRAKRRVRMLALGAVFAIAAAVPIGIIGAIPHAIQGWVQDRVSAYTEHAVDKMGQKMLYSYMKNRVAVEKCKSAYNLAGNVSGIGACRPRVEERDTRLSQLFNDWHAAKMEDMLAEHGINIEYDYSQRDSGKPYKITIDRPASEGGNFTASGKFGVPDIDTAEFIGKREASQILKKEMKATLKDDTKWWQFLKRRNLKAGYLRDLGLPSHIFPSKKVAKTLDNIDAVKLKATSEFRQYLTRFVVSHGDARVGALLEVLFSGESSKAKPADLIEKNKAFRAAAAKLGDEEVVKLLEKYAGKNLQEIEIQIVKDLIAKFNETLANQLGEAATDALPVIGWILFALTIMDLLDMATDNSLQHWISTMNSQSMVDVANFMDSTVSEERRGYVDAQSAGDMRMSLVNGLGSSRVFANLIGYKSIDGKQPAGYSCRPDVKFTDVSSIMGAGSEVFKGGDPTALKQAGMADDQLTCENHRVDYDPANALSPLFAIAQNGILGQGGLKEYTDACISKLLVPGFDLNNLPHIGPDCPSLQQIYHGGKGIIGWVTGHLAFLTNWISDIPPIKWLMTNITGWVTNAITVFITGQSLAGPELLQGGIKTDTKSGARLVDAWVGGGESQQFAFAKGVGNGGGLGGVPLTPDQVAELDTTIAQERKEELADSSFFDRMFDISHVDTMASGLLGMAVMDGGVGNFINPMNNLALVFGGSNHTGFGNTAYAEDTETKKSACGYVNGKGQAVTEFGVICYGIPDSYIDGLTDEQLQDLADPDKCDSQTSAIDAKRKEAEDGTDETKKDPDGTGTSTQIDGCRLVCSSTDAMGTNFRVNDKICGFEDAPTGSSSGSGSGSDTTAGTVNTNADYKALSQSILNSGRVVFDKDIDRKDIESGSGSCGNGEGPTVAINIKVLRVMDYILHNTGANLRIGAVDSGHHCNNGLHPKGLAFDIGNEEVAGEVMSKVFAARDQLGINEMFFNGSAGQPYTMDGGQASPGLYVPGHDDHIHIGVNP